MWSINSKNSIQEKPTVHSLFLPNNKNYGKDLLILSDSPGEILEVNPALHMTIDGYSLLSTLIRNPLKDKETIQKRQKEISRLVSVEDNTLVDILKRNHTIKWIFWVPLSEEMNMDNFIWYFQNMEFILSNERNELEAIFIWTTFHQIKEVWELIDEQIQSIGAIWWDFFVWLATELDDAKGKIPKLPIAQVFELLSKIKRTKEMERKFWRSKHKDRIKKTEKDLYNQLRAIYMSFMEDIQKFSAVYKVVDALCILSIWIKKWYIQDSSFSKREEYGNNIRDGRHLIGCNIHAFKNHITNNLHADQSPIEVYCWANGWGKSTWLKTRLSLQLFHQTFGYVAWEDVSLPVREKIVFMNRGWSGYQEDLSAFGSDVDKLKQFLPHVWDTTLILMDEFGSTIPEHEAYAFSRALLEFFRDSGAKTLFSTHNEELLQAMESWEISSTMQYHVPATVVWAWAMTYSRKLKKWVDIAHTLDVFEMEWFPKDILGAARILQNPWLQLKTKEALKIIPYSVTKYTLKEREKLKQLKNKAFAWLSRYNELIWMDNKYGGEFVHKYARLDGYQWVSQSIDINENWRPESLGEVKDMSYVSESILSNARKVPMLHHLYGRDYRRLNFWEETLQWVIKYGLTHDPRELHERQIFFRELSRIGFDFFDDVYARVNHLTWVASLTHPEYTNSFFDHLFKFDYSLLREFNTALWDELKKIAEDSREIASYTTFIIEDLLVLIEVERILGNLPAGFDEAIQDDIAKLKRLMMLLKKERRAQKRTSAWSYPTTSALAEKISSQIIDVINTEYSDGVDICRNIISAIYQMIHGSTNNTWVDIFKVSQEKRNAVCEYLHESCIFSRSYKPGEYYSMEREKPTSAQNGIAWMVQILGAMRWTGNLMQKVYDALRSLDSVHAHQIANYLEGITIVPSVEDVIKQIQRKADGKKKKQQNKWGRVKKVENNFRRSGWSLSSSLAFFELLWLVYASDQIQREWWIPAQYNESGDISLRWAWHPAKERLSKEKQVVNDFNLKPTEHFDILEWATMGGKTMHLQSVTWVLHLAHTLGYVPAESASVPLLDGIIYIDRILEDEKNNLSAWQNDAKYWKELIENIQSRIASESVNGRYWWAIDEMISSVPPRYQRWLVIAVLETLKSLGQRWQISIHNPEFVSKILAMDSDHYTVHHPEVTDNEDWIVHPTHKIVWWRSVDRDWRFSAFSVETAQSMWIPDFIIKEAKKYR